MAEMGRTNRLKGVLAKQSISLEHFIPCVPNRGDDCLVPISFVLSEFRESETSRRTSYWWQREESNLLLRLNPYGPVADCFFETHCQFKEPLFQLTSVKRTCLFKERAGDELQVYQLYQIHLQVSP